ncbi:MAG: glycosyltransferase [Pseudomonadota bacterium]
MSEKTRPSSHLPSVSLIKPVYGLEKDLYTNLITACEQDYPDYEVIYSVQRRDDPALEILQRIRQEFKGRNIHILVNEKAIGPNGKLSNLYNASQRATGDVFVISDSDMSFGTDYLKTIVAPFADERVGISCTLYKASCPANIFEVLELLTYNADFVPSMVFAIVTKTSIACPGNTHAIRRTVLEMVGGLAPLAHYLVEDYELGRRVVEAGFQICFTPYVVDNSVDLGGFRDWWRHQVYWDQNTRSANPSGFYLTLLVRGIPFALLYACLGGLYGWTILAITVGLRMVTAIANSIMLEDRDGMKCSWLLPLRDLSGVFVWFASFVKRDTYWRGKTFALKKGKLVEME